MASSFLAMGQSPKWGLLPGGHSIIVKGARNGSVLRGRVFPEGLPAGCDPSLFNYSLNKISLLGALGPRVPSTHSDEKANGIKGLQSRHDGLALRVDLHLLYLTLGLYSNGSWTHSNLVQVQFQHSCIGRQSFTYLHARVHTFTGLLS